MTREQLLKRYKIHRYNQRDGSFYFRVKKQCWPGIIWFFAKEWYYDSCYKRSWDNYEGALEWVNEDVDDRLAIYNSDVITIDKFEPLIQENKLLKELIDLIR